MLPTTVAQKLEQTLGERIERTESLSGGCIAHATRVFGQGGCSFFVKWADGLDGPLLHAEGAGLRELSRASGALRVPQVLASLPESEGVPALLVLEWIDQGPRTSNFWRRFGEGLAQLHRTLDVSFGFYEDNFIGRLPQRNDRAQGWVAFFREMRLLPQIERARTSGHWRRSWDVAADRLLSTLGDILPDAAPPSLLHGDLWGGNFLAGLDGRAVLIDPAVYFGHREADLAMTELFGGFDPGFYAAYDGAWPLEPGYPERRDLYNLYHLLNHLNHFGDLYLDSVQRTLDRFR